MKKLFVLFAAAAMIFAACQEEMIPVTDETIDGAALEEYPVEMDFTATTEMGTKTTLNGTTVSWEAEDQIKVLWEGGSNVAKTEEGGAEASFSTRVDEGVTEFWAAYPYSESTVLEDGKLVVNIPSEQSGVFAGANYSVAKTSGSLLEFKHLVGLVEVSTSLANANRITIKGAENDVLAGVITVSGFNAETGLPEYEVAEGAKEIVLEVSGAGTYYAALIPTAELKCLSVCVETTDGENATSDYALSANTLKMERAKVMALGNVDSRLGKNYFVTATADGTGDGKTWETAFNYQQMAKMLSANRKGALSDDYSDEAYKETHKTVHAAEVHEHTFHMAAGTYQSANYLRIKFAENDSPVKISIKGGYDPASKGTDLSQRSGAENITKIKGALGEEGGSGTKRVFLINQGVNLILEHITLADGIGDEKYGGGAVFMDHASSTLTCRDCVISGHTSPINGAAIYAIAGTLDFTGCVFSKNVGTGDSTFGGAIYAKTVSLTCTECDFIENTSINNGGAVWLSGVTKADFTDCNFTKNGTDNLAGAICLSGANPLNIIGGTFSENTSKLGGGCFYNNAASKITISGTTFSNNSSDKIGGVFYNNTTSGPVITITDALFEENTAVTEGGAIIFKAGTWNIENTTIKNNVSGTAGGAIWATGSTKVTINGVTFEGNEAEKNEAGAIFFNGGTWTIENTTIKNNKAKSNGGAIYAHTGSLTVKDSDFEGNETTEGSVGGGAIYVTTNSALSVEGSTFTSNKAKGSYTSGNNTVYRKGGAIAMANTSGAAHTIKSSSFVSNESAWGGGVYISTKELNIADCSFEQNVSTKAGGAMYGEGASLKLCIDKSHFSKNASVQGAAIRTANGVLYMNACTVTGNKPSNNNTGGVLYLGKTSFINNCCFYENDKTAASYVSDIVINAAPATILNTTIVEKESNVTGIRTYNTSDDALTSLYNNTIVCGHKNLGVGWGDLLGSVTSCGYNYTGPWVVENASSVAQTVDTDTVVTPDDVFGNFTLTNNADGENWYTWTAPSDLGKTTKTAVETFLKSVTGGADFLTWLGTVNGLTQDIAGNARPETGWYPGCYQGK